MKKETTGKWLEGVKKALSAGGFKPTEFQRIKPGQVYGLVKDLDDIRQMHVRGFEDGHLDSEVEISRRYLEHPGTERPATKELRKILNRHGIRYRVEPKLVSPIRTKVKVPTKLTPWRSRVRTRLYKGVGLTTLAAGILTLVLTQFLGRIGESTLAIFLTLVGVGGVILGFGILRYSILIDKIVKEEFGK